MRAPMAAVLIGGNISSTLLTLVLVPVMYNFFEWLSVSFSRLWRKLFSVPQTKPVDRSDKDRPGPTPAPQPGA